MKKKLKRMSEEEMKDIETEKPTENEDQEESEVPSWASLGLDSRILAGLGKSVKLVFSGDISSRCSGNSPKVGPMDFRNHA